MQFKNREDAAMKLMPYLEKYKNDNCVILAVPRGGVPVAYYIAKKFNFPLDLLMTKKIGHPYQREFAIGAVSLEDYIIDDRTDIPQSYFKEKIKSIREQLKQQYKKFAGNNKPVDLKNKVVIIVDDGMATGYTILSSIKMIKKRLPGKIVVAVPVSPIETAAKVHSQVDEFLCPYTPENFIGVGFHYRDFTQVEDEEVIRLFKDANHFEKAA